MDKLHRDRLSILLKNAITLPGQDKRRLYGNNYRMEPIKKFARTPVEKIIKELLKQTLQDEPYNASVCQKHCINLSAELRARIKMLNIPRYKYVCLVSISESKCSELLMSSRCLWDLKFDNYAWYKFENKELIAVGIVYACYFE